MEEEKVLTNVQQVAADEVATQEEAKNEVVAEAAVEGAPTEDELSVKTEAPTVPTVPTRPHKPHSQARPCPNWGKYHPGSPLLEKGERPCQGWVVKSGTRHCYFCCLEERYVPEEKQPPIPKVTQRMVDEALTAAVGIPGDRPKEWKVRGVLQRVVVEFRDSSPYKEAVEIAQESVKLFQGEKPDFVASFTKIQEFVPKLLEGLGRWCYQECHRWLDKKHQSEEDKRILERVEEACQEWQNNWADELARAKANNEFPRWGRLEAATEKLQEAYAKVVRPRRNEDVRKHKRFGVHLIL